MSEQKIIAITGGIGSGKSVVCRILRSMGYPVYDCDLEARRLQESSAEMRRQIAESVTPLALNQDGTLNRAALAECVFSFPEKLRRLNEIVHSAVAADFLSAVRGKYADCPLVFIETAILYESGFDKLVDEIWEVTAPEEVRISRVMARNGLTAEQVRARIDSQNSPNNRNSNHHIIINDGKTPVLPQILDELTRRF